MKVWRCTPGSLDNLELVEENLPPKPQNGFVRVKVKACGLNFADVAACLGLYSAIPKEKPYFVPGLEFAGEIIAIGDTSEEAGGGKRRKGAEQGILDSKHRVGDKVICLTRFGGFAQEIDVDVRYARPLPEGWSYEQGAGYIVQALTAYYAIYELGGFRPERHNVVLVHSAAGGVGLNALDMLHKAQDTKVIATVGSESKVPFLKQRCTWLKHIIVRNPPTFGAQLKEELIEEKRALDAPVYGRNPDRLDLVLDSLLDASCFAATKDMLNPMGRVIVYGAGSMMPKGEKRVKWLKMGYRYLMRPKLDPLAMMHENMGVLCFNLIWLWNEYAFLDRMMKDMMEQCDRTPHVGHVLKFEDLDKGLELMLSGTSMGKVVLVVD